MKHDPACQESGDAVIPASIAPLIDRAVSAAGSCLDREDLEQVAHLTMLEARPAVARLPYERRLDYVRSRVDTALRAELAAFADRQIELVGLAGMTADPFGRWTEAVESPPPEPAWGGTTGEERASTSEIAEHVWAVVARMPEATATVARLRFGLDGGDELTPSEVAERLGTSTEVVRRHLRVVERLFCHLSADRRHRRRALLSDAELAAFRRIRDLAWYDLRHLNLNNTDLGRCDLSEAVLSGMNLWGANLAGSRLANANLWGAQLEGADLAAADLHGANLERAGLAGVRLSGATLASVNLWGADLGRAQLDGAALTAADLRSANLAGANLAGADLRGADLRSADLAGADLTGADLRGADLRDIELRRARPVGVRPEAFKLNGADLGVAAAPPKPRRIQPAGAA